MRYDRGFRTRDLLVAAMALIIASATLASLLIVRHRLESQVTSGLSAELLHSVATFEDLEQQKLSALERENALLADLPSLKALMTTNDDRTIEDGAVEFWKVSGNDLFALADKKGRVVAVDTKGPQSDHELRNALQILLENPARHYLISRGRLFQCSVRPLYFGSEQDGTLLGYVVSGFSIDHAMVEQISRATTVEATFIGNGQAVASTLTPAIQKELTSHSGAWSRGTTPVSIKLGGEQYLAVQKDFSARASAPLHLVVLKSFDQAVRSIRQIDRLLLLAGVMSMLLGTVLMMALSRLVTRPLEELASGVRAFGVGDSAHLLPHRGTREVQELSLSFASMRREIQQANRSLLEAERLATIGRMASSVSHDLRHYLAAIYANAEFLASAALSELERSEIFADIRTAVHGTTELLESLLIFSRTGSAVRRSEVPLATLVERSMMLLRSHPDAAGVILTAKYDDPSATAAVVDEKQIERAIYNLLLNGCQSVSATTEAARVAATLHPQNGQIILEIEDNGSGVPENIRTTLFEPFVSEGKQKGSGIGLTLAHCIAVEHGGEVILVSSRPGETIFRMSIECGAVRQIPQTKENRKSVEAG
ncbi:MAG TPA: ATP-binding protein [Acidobacteriaceae bacterium]|nr:ATP-binding protein [Acidobacteriaceae bacterium]